MMKVEPYRECLPLSDKMRRAVWNVCRAVLFRPFGGPWFTPWRRLLLRAWGASMGCGADVRSSAVVWAPWNLVMGDYACVGPDAVVYNPGRVTLGHKVTVSQGARLFAASHDITDPRNRLLVAPIVLHDFAWVAAEAFVGMGVTVGAGAVVGARAAVFKDVEPWTVVGGNPAQFIKRRVMRDE